MPEPYTGFDGHIQAETVFNDEFDNWLKSAAYLKEEFEDGDKVFYKGEKDGVITAIYSSGVIDVQWRDGDTEEIKPNERKYLSHHYPARS